MMQTKVIGTQETLKFLDKATDEALAILDREMKVSGARVLADSQRTLQKEGKHATGRLMSSGRVQTQPGLVKVEYNALYARFVEHGRKAGKWPPHTPIADWVKQRGIASDPKEIRQVAFLIARKIGKRGIKPTPFLVPAFLKERVKFINKLKTIFK